MGVLDSVLKYKAMKDAQDAQAGSVVGTAVDMFIKGRQNAQKNVIDMLTLDAALAKSGLKRTKDGFARDESLQSPMEEFINRGKIAQSSLQQQQAGIGGLIGGSGTQALQAPNSLISSSGQLATGTPSASAQASDAFATQATLNVAGQPTSTTVKSEEGLRRESKIKREESVESEKLKTAGKQAENILKNDVNFSKVVNLMSNMVSQKKAQLDETGGAGIVKGAIGNVAAKVKTPGYSQTGAFGGQVTETTLALNSILTGQNRVIKGVVDMIRPTLPTEFDTEQFTADKIAQSLKNSFRLSKSMKDAKIRPEFFENMSEEDATSFSLPLAKLSKEESEGIDQLIKQVLNTPRAKKYSLTNNEQESFKTTQEADKSGLPAGTVVLVGGRRYQI